MRSLQLGVETYFLEHIGQVYNKYTFDEHGLKLDIRKIDRKYWALIKSICRLKVYKCLNMLQTSGNTHKKKTLGIKLCLRICPCITLK
jgi:hypothetical protein